MKTFITITEKRTYEIPNDFELEADILDAIERKDLDALSDFLVDLSDMEPISSEIVAVEHVRKAKGRG